MTWLAGCGLLLAAQAGRAEEGTLRPADLIGTWIGYQLASATPGLPMAPGTSSVMRELVFRADGSFTMTNLQWSGRYRIEGMRVQLGNLYVLTYHPGGLTGFQMVFARKAR